MCACFKLHERITDSSMYLLFFVLNAWPDCQNPKIVTFPYTIAHTFQFLPVGCDIGWCFGIWRRAMGDTCMLISRARADYGMLLAINSSHGFPSKKGNTIFPQLLV